MWCIMGWRGALVGMGAGTDIRFTVPLYTVRQVGQFLQVPPSTVAHWRPLVQRAGAPRRGDSGVTFIGLAEAAVLAAFRHAGVSMQRIRPAIAVLKETTGLEHALVARRLFTDGVEVLYRWGNEEAPDSIARLVTVRNGQQVFTDVVRDYLKLITWGADGFPTMLRLPAYRHTEVIIDPRRSFGQPFFSRSGVKVEDVLHRIWAGEDFDTVATDYGLARADVEDALRVASRSAS